MERLPSSKYDFDIIKDIVVNLGPKYNVYVFGGFVRDHIVQFASLEEYEITKLAGDDYPFGDLDMWAQTEQNARSFMDDLISKHKYKKDGPTSKRMARSLFGH